MWKGFKVSGLVIIFAVPYTGPSPTLFSHCTLNDPLKETYKTLNPNPLRNFLKARKNPKGHSSSVRSSPSSGSLDLHDRKRESVLGFVLGALVVAVSCYDFCRVSRLLMLIIGRWGS